MHLGGLKVWGGVSDQNEERRPFCSPVLDPSTRRGYCPDHSENVHQGGGGGGGGARILYRYWMPCPSRNTNGL